MLMLLGKLLFGFSFILIFSLNTITLAQPDFLNYFCETAANYTANSTYKTNLDTTLSVLPTTNSGLGFFNRSTGQGNNTVNSVALCRGDVERSVCQSCLNDSIVKLREICPNEKEAIGYYDNCLLKYSNEIILGNTSIKFYLGIFNTQNSTDITPIYFVGTLLTELKSRAAAGGPLQKFATGNTTWPGFSTIYALVQCTPDLSMLQCDRCLEDLIQQIAISFSSYNGRVGGRLLVPMCNVRFESYMFFNESNLAIPPPPSPSSSPILQQSPPPPSGKKNNTTTIIVIVIVSVIVVIIIISLCIFVTLRKKKRQTLQHPHSESIHTETMDMGNAESLQYNFSAIKATTNDFSEDNKLERG